MHWWAPWPRSPRAGRSVRTVTSTLEVPTTVDPATARAELAALFRACALHDYHEGIDNHCSLAVAPGRFLLNPYGPHWSELRASDLLEVDDEGRVHGAGEAETTAFFLHWRLHTAHPDARCVVHTHMPWTTALACTRGGFETRLSQNAARFHGRIAFEETYGGRIVDAAEGDALAAAVADGVRVVLLANHGVLVVAESVAHAWYDLYFLERAAQVQVLAAGAGELRLMSEPTARTTAEQFDEERALHAEPQWAAVKRRLDRENPGYEA
jgi:ribulose-5-phosphate 4-epimerase/fuculose-1-phosphate aldolase